MKTLTMSKATGLLLLGLAGMSGRAGAQLTLSPDESDLVDRVVAVVGDSVLLLTQVEEALIQIQAAGGRLPNDPAALEEARQQVLQDLINEQLMLQAALRDTLIVPNEARIEDIVQQDLDGRIRSFGTQAQMQAALVQQGLTLASFKELLLGRTRRAQLSQQYVARRTQSLRIPPILEAESRAYFDTQADQLPERPATVAFKQVIVVPKASTEAREAARAEAERILELVADDGDFEALAKQYSQDPGSAQIGGDLGWFRQGRMVKEFDDVVFSLRRGDISGVVESQFGYHIIRLDRIRGAERKAAHILTLAEIGPEDVARAQALAGEVRSRLEAGEDIEALIDEFHEGETPDSLEIPMDQLTQLPPGYGILRSATPGALLGPIQWESGGRQSMAVVKILDVREAGTLTFEDVQVQIEQILQDQRALELIIEELRENAFVEIRE